ncbi:unnamed protein product (macronuclear) [Paramecium tetraurelia]|uniref:Uncharacterized protein n=1 Tax=Paramecium tetraurelia TaxID=5888 RepID=A0BG73_PARTE|nr:uncharacterized protein GSPATT00028575001 [Paramecium tetraurelia]CAK57540.1 unnamed protein product [Paramecium tetraurelia]|eukprot:XP_001424938.1 hypothetical protein (macronuclear) [Paramecium tetraurelia strain d4-2]
MQFHLQHSSLIESFLTQFGLQKQNQVVEFLITMGIDLANKIGARNPKELYYQLKQLSSINITLQITENIKEQTSGDIKNEIKTIQKQIRDLNDLIQISQRENKNAQGTLKKYIQPTQINSNRYEQYEQCEDNYVHRHHYQNKHQTYNTQRSQSKSPVHLSDRTPHQLKHSRSQSQRNLTPKITESPPPPQIVYINNMHNKFDIKPQFDDRQIKKLMYGDSKNSDRGRYFGKGPSPQQLVYSSQTSGGLSYRQYPGQVIHHQTDKQKQNTSPKKLPAYLQNVESKIKPLVDQDKLQYRETQRDRESNKQQQGTVKKFNNNSLQQQNSAETDTFFDIQQYIQDQKKCQFSPVQEINDDERNEDIEASDTFSNFSPPNEEVKEFFQQEYLQQRR